MYRLYINQHLLDKFKLYVNINKEVIYLGKQPKGTDFSLDTHAALNWLVNEPDSAEKNVLAYQIEHFHSWQ